MNVIAEEHESVEVSEREKIETKEELLDRLLEEHLGVRLNELERLHQEHQEMFKQWESDIDECKAFGNIIEREVRLELEGASRQSQHVHFSLKAGLTRIGSSNVSDKINNLKLNDRFVVHPLDPVLKRTESESSQQSSQLHKSMIAAPRPKSVARGGLSRNQSEAVLNQSMVKAPPTMKNSMSKSFLLDEGKLPKLRLGELDKNKGAPISRQSMNGKSMNQSPSRSALVTPRGETGTQKSEQKGKLLQELNKVSRVSTDIKKKLQEREKAPLKKRTESMGDVSKSLNMSRIIDKKPEAKAAVAVVKPKDIREKVPLARNKSVGKERPTTAASTASKEDKNKSLNKSINRGQTKTKTDTVKSSEKLENKNGTISVASILDELSQDANNLPNGDPSKDSLASVTTKNPQPTTTPVTSNGVLPHQQEVSKEAYTEKAETDNSEPLKTTSVPESVADSTVKEVLEQKQPTEQQATESSGEKAIVQEDELSIVERGLNKTQLKQKLEAKGITIETYIANKSTKLENNVTSSKAVIEKIKQGGDIKPFEHTAFKFSNNLQEITNMVEDSWLDELSQKQNTDQRVYTVLRMFLKIRRQESILCLGKNPEAFWKSTIEYLRTDQGNINKCIMKLKDDAQNLPIDLQISLEKDSKSASEVLEASTYDEIDALIGCLSFALKEICLFYGIQISEPKGSNEGNLNKVVKFNENKIDYYSNQRDKITELAKTYSISNS